MMFDATDAAKQPFVLWYKTDKPEMEMHGFHLGLNLKVAKDIAEMQFSARNMLSLNWVQFVELRRAGKVIGRWDGVVWEMMTP